MSKTMPTLLYRQDFSIIPEIKPRLVCELRAISTADIEDLKSVRTLSEFKIDQFHQRMERGDQCFVAVHAGKPVHFSWLQTSGSHPISPAARSWLVKPGEAWIYDCRTADVAQRNGIYPFVLTSILRHLNSQSFTYAWIYTSTSNIASQKGIKKAGFKLKKHLYCIEFGAHILRLPPVPW